MPKDKSIKDPLEGYVDVSPPKEARDPLSAWTSPQDVNVEKEPSPIELMIGEMLGRENLEMKTDLTDNLIIALTKGTIYANIYNNPLMKSLVETISLYRVSRNRKGRDEIKDMAKSLGTSYSDEAPSFMSRLFKGD